MERIAKGSKSESTLKPALWSIFDNVEMDKDAKTALVESILTKIEEVTSLTGLQEKLSILYEYEKNYLGLIKEFKEEIKFAASLQEDLRKERAKFFSDSLKEVSETLKSAQVDDAVSSVWMQELVASYTKSLDLSNGLIEEHTLDTIGEIRREARKSAKALKATDESA